MKVFKRIIRWVRELFYIHCPECKKGHLSHIDMIGEAEIKVYKCDSCGKEFIGL